MGWCFALDLTMFKIFRLKDFPYLTFHILICRVRVIMYTSVGWKSYVRKHMESTQQSVWQSKCPANWCWFHYYLDPPTTWVWTVQVHLWVDFFTAQHRSKLPCLWDVKPMSRGLTFCIRGFSRADCRTWVCLGSGICRGPGTNPEGYWGMTVFLIEKKYRQVESCSVCFTEKDAVDIIVWSCHSDNCTP